VKTWRHGTGADAIRQDAGAALASPGAEQSSLQARSAKKRIAAAYRSETQQPGSRNLCCYAQQRQNDANNIGRGGKRRSAASASLTKTSEQRARRVSRKRGHRRLKHHHFAPRRPLSAGSLEEDAQQRVASIRAGGVGGATACAATAARLYLAPSAKRVGSATGKRETAASHAFCKSFTGAVRISAFALACRHNAEANWPSLLGDNGG